MWQADVRRLPRRSAVPQTDYGLTAIVAFGRSELAVSALDYFMVAYPLAIVAAGGVVVQLRGESVRDRYPGLSATPPCFEFELPIALLSFERAPPLAGFAAKVT